MGDSRWRGWFAGALLLGLAAGLAAGCKRDIRVDLRPGAREIHYRKYPDVLQRWTRERRVIRHFDTVINVTATYQSAEYVSAYMALYAQHYRLPKGEHRRLLVRRLTETERYHEFYLAVTVADPDWYDFEESKSVWKISLWNDRGTRVKPLAVKRLTINEVHRTYFPYTGTFHRAYRVVFPRTVGGRPLINPSDDYFKLQIASPMGVAELAWFLNKQDT